MGLFKTSILNGVAVLIKMATMFILNKILAIYVGPSGYAVIGQFQNFTQTITMFTGTAINNGIVKYTAEYHNDTVSQRLIWHAASKFIFVVTFIFSFIIYLYRSDLSRWIFKTEEYSYVLIWFAIFLIFFNLNALLLAILNGLQQIKKLVLANILGSIISLIITGFMAVKYSLPGALIAISIYQSINCFVTFWVCKKIPWLFCTIIITAKERAIIYKLLPFALMAFTSVIVGNFAQITLREMIIHKFDIQHAGYWDAMNRLSGAYLMMATTILGVYYLPKLSALTKYEDVLKEVRLGYKTILPIAAIGAVVVFIFRKIIILILFSEDFLPMLQLMFWQLIGDVVKIGSWIISFMMLSKAMTKLFIICEAFFALSIIPITYLCITIFGYEGISVAFTTNCLLYWIVCSFFSKRELKKNAT